MSNKTITYPSGTILRRKIKGSIETWELENKSLNTSIFKIDLSNCEGIKFEDGKGNTREVKVEHLKTKEMFSIK